MNKTMAKPDMSALGRTIKKLFGYYPVLAPLTVACILFSSIVTSVPSIFLQNVLAIVEKWYTTGDWASAKAEIVPYLVLLGTLYVLSILSQLAYTQLMAIMTQGFLDKLRQEVFGGMQDLPIKFFDTNKHGDIMSYYTNDIDTLRQLVSQAVPALIQSAAIVLTVFAIMLYFSIWLTLVLVLGVVAMAFVAKRIGGGSARYFLQAQKSVARAEGYVQEMMNGQKVIKVFCHERQSIEDFDKVNDALYNDSYRANAYANTLGPIIGNIGNVLYVVLALVGGVFLLTGVRNFSLSGMAFDVTILVPFLNMAKQFTGNVNQLSQQINAVVMAAAGAQRIFSLVDQPPEADNGYVTLVNARIAPDGSITECEERTGHWAWRHPHTDGTLTYTELRGDVRMVDVDFAYEEGKDVLHDVSVYAEPGQKVAFVGATGAGKTTITNLINRFYDIADGKIRYDGININKIKKADLRRSLGIVLQDTNLFTGSVMENIRYGRLDATDEDCIAAARLAGADDFITRLPRGYDTELSGNGANLSQGQRQLIAIARAILADPDLLILDEATSSIDTRTEIKIQDAMLKLMEGRTSFIIAHRLSTIRNADKILVINAGEVVEQGTHDELLAADGFYAKLYNIQFKTGMAI